MSITALVGTVTLVGILVALLAVTVGLAYLDNYLDAGREH